MSDTKEKESKAIRAIFGGRWPCTSAIGPDKIVGMGDYAYAITAEVCLKAPYDDVVPDVTTVPQSAAGKRIVFAEDLYFSGRGLDRAKCIYAESRGRGKRALVRVVSEESGHDLLYVQAHLYDKVKKFLRFGGAEGITAFASESLLVLMCGEYVGAIAGYRVSEGCNV